MVTLFKPRSTRIFGRNKNINQELEQTLLNINDKHNSYNEHEWYSIVESLLDDFQKFVGFSFERSLKKDIFLEIKYPNNPAFSTDLWTPLQQKEGGLYSPLWMKFIRDKVFKDKDKSHCLSIKWFGWMSGAIHTVSYLKESKDIFCITVTFLLFHPISKERLYINNEKGLLMCFFVPQFDHSGEWEILGWAEDEFDEWDHINSWDDLLI